MHDIVGGQPHHESPPHILSPLKTERSLRVIFVVWVCGGVKLTGKIVLEKCVKKLRSACSDFSLKHWSLEKIVSHRFKFRCHEVHLVREKSALRTGQRKSVLVGRGQVAR